MPSYPEFADRIVAITGAAQGIGAVTALAFAQEKARVALLDLDEPGAQAVAKEIAGAGGHPLAVHTNVTDEQSVAAAVARVVAEYGGIDILVNCAISSANSVHILSCRRHYHRQSFKILRRF